MKIILGTGSNELRVDDGASVPLAGRDDMVHRAKLRLVDGSIVVLLTSKSQQTYVAGVNAVSGLIQQWYDLRIDLPALRRELAPKVKTVGGWTPCLPGDNGREYAYPRLTVQQEPSSRHYWTHRPGNTPEKQAALDAALGTWCSFMERHYLDAPKTDEVEQMFQAARALGYGSNP
jgi:hypothetical protein